jgi:hypothetical protein
VIGAGFDEYDGGDDGVLFLAERHADLFQRALCPASLAVYALPGVANAYLIMVAEKQIC